MELLSSLFQPLQIKLRLLIDSDSLEGDDRIFDSYQDRRAPLNLPNDRIRVFLTLLAHPYIPYSPTSKLQSPNLLSFRRYSTWFELAGLMRLS